MPVQTPVERQAANPFQELRPLAEREEKEKEPPAQSPKTQLDERTAIQALDRLRALMRERTEPGRYFIYGPNFDGCYYYRVKASDEHQGGVDFGAEEKVDAQKKFALDAGVPHYREVSWEEETLLNMAVYWGRQDKLYSSQANLVVKHFPGTPSRQGDDGRALEGTETRSVTIHGGLPAFAPQLASFRLAIRGPYPARGIMTSHAIYPDLARDIKAKRGEMGRFAPSDPVPGTFSPYIIRGLLRQELGYKGAVFSDWAGSMDAITAFTDWAAQKKAYTVKQEGRSVTITDDRAVQTLAGVEAGLNFIVGAMTPYAAMDEKVEKQLEDFAKQNPSWLKKLDELAAFDRQWLVDRYPQLDALNPPVAKMTLKQKIELIYTKMEEPSREYGKYDASQNYADAWNRKGILVMEFRKNCLESMTGQTFPSMAEFAKEGSLRVDGEAFLKALWAAPGFKEAYEAMDWGSDAARKAFERAVAKGQKEGAGVMAKR